MLRQDPSLGLCSGSRAPQFVVLQVRDANCWPTVVSCNVNQQTRCPKTLTIIHIRKKSLRHHETAAQTTRQSYTTLNACSTHITTVTKHRQRQNVHIHIRTCTFPSAPDLTTTYQPISDPATNSSVQSIAHRHLPPLPNRLRRLHFYPRARYQLPTRRDGGLEQQHHPENPTSPDLRVHTHRKRRRRAERKQVQVRRQQHYYSALDGATRGRRRRRGAPQR